MCSPQPTTASRRAAPAPATATAAASAAFSAEARPGSPHPRAREQARDPHWHPRSSGSGTGAMWQHPNAASLFVAFGVDVVERLGHLVDFWVIFNEPVIYTSLSHCMGMWPPGPPITSMAVKVRPPPPSRLAAATTHYQSRFLIHHPVGQLPHQPGDGIAQGAAMAAAHRL